MIWILTIGIALFIAFHFIALVFADEYEIFQYYWMFVVISFLGLTLFAISYGIASGIICASSNGDSKYCIKKEK